MILDSGVPYPMSSSLDDVVIYVVIAIIIAIGVFITIKYINKKGSVENSEEKNN